MSNIITSVITDRHLRCLSCDLRGKNTFVKFNMGESEIILCEDCGAAMSNSFFKAMKKGKTTIYDTEKGSFRYTIHGISFYYLDLSRIKRKVGEKDDIEEYLENLPKSEFLALLKSEEIK